MYPVVEEYGKSVVGRLSGKLYPFEKDLALANWDFAWSRDLYLMLHELAVSAGNSTKKLQKAKSLLYVRLKSGHGLAYLWLMLPHIQKWAGLDWIEKHVALAKYEFARNVNFLMKKLNITVKESEQKYRYENQSFSKDPNNPEHCPEMIYAHPTDLSMFQDEYFDAVYVDQALHWLGPTFQDLQRAVDELMRVLKPGGVIFGGSLREYGWNSIFNLLVKTRRGAHGIVTGRQFKELFKKHNVEAKQYTPIGVFAMIKPE
jgi:SAM-dependent methyltransferase